MDSDQTEPKDLSVREEASLRSLVASYAKMGSLFKAAIVPRWKKYDVAPMVEVISQVQKNPDLVLTPEMLRDVKAGRDILTKVERREKNAENKALRAQTAEQMDAMLERLGWPKEDPSATVQKIRPQGRLPSMGATHDRAAEGGNGRE